jgi:hypothetical protein
MEGSDGATGDAEEEEMEMEMEMELCGEEAKKV